MPPHGVYWSQTGARGIQLNMSASDDDGRRATATGDFIIFCDRVESALHDNRDLEPLFQMYKDALIRHKFIPDAYLNGGKWNDNGVLRNPHRYSDNRFHNNLVICAYELLVSELGDPQE